jgi:hypothetical protein
MTHEELKDEEATPDFWEGFETAILLVLNYIKEGGFFEDSEIANQLADEIIDEAEIYRKDG